MRKGEGNTSGAAQGTSMSKTVSEDLESDMKEAVKLVKATGGCIQLYSPSTLLYHMCIALVSPKNFSLTLIYGLFSFVYKTQVISNDRQAFFANGCKCY